MLGSQENKILFSNEYACILFSDYLRFLVVDVQYLGVNYLDSDRLVISDAAIRDRIITNVGIFTSDIDTSYPDVPTTIIPLYVNYIGPVSGDIKIDLFSGLMRFFNYEFISTG